MEKKPTFLAIGDIVIDAFIRIKDASVTCELDNVACKLCLRYGDKVPFESVDIINAVGNSANAAVSASRLGLTSYLRAHVGDDQHGKDCIQSLISDNVDTTYIQSDNGIPTNYHYVLWYDVDRTILVKHAEFPYNLPEQLEQNPPEWMYLSSLGENSLEYHKQIAEYLDRHPETKLAFQPGTFQMKLGKEVLSHIYTRTEVFFCNVEEAMRILGTKENELSGTREENVVYLMKKMKELGPKVVSITDGIQGAYAYDGTSAWFMPVYPHDPYERTGAGDAFASTFTCALALGKSLDEALLWGPINSMSVVQYVGAQKGLLTRVQLEEHLRNAPQDYLPKKLI